MYCQFARPVVMVRCSSTPGRRDEDEHTIALLDRSGRNAQRIGARVQHDLHVRAVAHQQDLGLLGIAELDFHVDGARLLLDVEHVGRDAPHVALELAIRERVDADASRHVEADRGRVDLVDRRGDVQAAVVDQVHRGRGRDAGRGGDGHLAELSGDLRDDAGERCAQIGARQVGLHGRHVRPGLLHVGLGGAARHRAGLRLRVRLVDALDADEALVLELAGAVGVAAREIRREAGLLRPQLRGLELILGHALLRNRLSFHNSSRICPRLTRSPFTHAQLRDLPAGQGRQLGAAAGSDRGRAGVGDGALHRAAIGASRGPR